jgi:hypothetical protein
MLAHGAFLPPSLLLVIPLPMVKDFPQVLSSATTSVPNPSAALTSK